MNKTQHFHLVTIKDLTNTDGRPVEYFWYSPWGETLQADNSWRGWFSSPFKFTGHIEDEETGLTYAGARYYPARESQWLSVDPLAEKYPTLTPYNYVANNPINATDPDGRKIKWNLSAVVVWIAMSMTETGKDNFRNMRKDKNNIYQFRLSFSVGIDHNRKNKTFGVATGEQSDLNGNPNHKLHTIYLGSYWLSKKAKKRYGKKWSELEPQQQVNALNIFVKNRNKKIEFIQDGGSDTGKKYSLTKEFMAENTYISGTDANYVDYSPENETLINFIERISIHESTHGLVESGVWKDRDKEFRQNLPGSNHESYPQERERLWRLEKQED